MTLTLAPGISFCDADGGRVFLDIRHDRYFCLGTAADDAFAALIAGRALGDPERERLAHLVGGGILVENQFGEVPRPCRAPAVTASALDNDRTARPPSFATIAAALTVQRAKIDMKLRPLASIMAKAEIYRDQHASDVGHASETELAAIAAAFFSSRRLVGALHHCLPYSLALFRRCHRAGLAAKLCLGVKLKPFQAHAWVIVDETVVSDPLSVVQPFTLIFVL